MYHLLLRNNPLLFDSREISPSLLDSFKGEIKCMSEICALLGHTASCGVERRSHQIRGGSLKSNVWVVSYSKFDIAKKLFRPITVLLNRRIKLCWLLDLLYLLLDFRLQAGIMFLSVAVLFSLQARLINCILLHHINVCKIGNLRNGIHRIFFLFNLKPSKA
jgi:hypothetical protein